MTDASRFAAALSTADDPRVAASLTCRDVLAQLDGAPVTLAVVFASPHLCADAEGLLATIRTELAPAHLIGCMGEAIIGAAREVEGAPALSLWCAHLPGALVTTFRLDARSVDDGYEFEGLPDEAGAGGTPVILLADPFTFPADMLLSDINGRDGPQIVGGLASGGAARGDHRLFLDDMVLDEGAVGVTIAGAPLVAVVSQGCAPIGPDMVITAGGGPVVGELAGKPAFEKITEVVGDLPAAERRLLDQPILAGIVIDENQPEYGRGDFLIRGIHGRDPETGAVYVGERVRIGQTFRLHVRDARSAGEDLRLALRRADASAGGLSPAGGLMFTCNGRGTHMFETPDHDARAVADELGVPTAGMFCNGEIGPVGGKTFLHGFTATMALFLTPID